MKEENVKVKRTILNFLKMYSSFIFSLQYVSLLFNIACIIIEIAQK
ncbi:hypothetical protein [Anaerocellum diazotrophicum]|uniref:Uncharacterized protein n=1 Tax=Caldicellulosiruptor diazotrophicus TaxID=2806205 RepID=A0ABM7NJF9_9FIRM|nr:hypothetical protein [Caldicellulosiruptor diazotrophicus]BCS80239.1 hypothetical protein CaldiYA01_01990 [Caldicellulosiruptor diazotrophicus]